MTENEMMQRNIEDFSRVQEWLLLLDKESEAYQAIKRRYIDLKVILTSSGVDLTEILLYG